MKNVFSINKFEKVKTYTTYRKIALGTWKKAYDPSTYCMIEFDARNAVRFLKEINAKEGVQLKIGNLLSQAFTLAMEVRPDINTVQRGSTLYRRTSVDAFHQVILLGKGQDRFKSPDLSGVVIKKAHQCGLLEQDRKLKQLVSDQRNGISESAKAQANLITKIPNFFMHTFLNISSFLIYDLNLKLPFLGITEDPFGSFIFSDNSAIRIPNAFMPLVPYARVGLFVSMGKVVKKPVVENDQIIIGEVLPVTITFDHRLVEGFQMAEMYRIITLALSDPEKYLLHAPEIVAREYFHQKTPVTENSK
jgi:pyruvate/2-oxoglutarate dehydrogenase complex dihydrolipoamide acyltransferase (E2) component